MSKLAFDKSVRTVDQDGRMHVQISNISKATVNPYRGNEIPDAEQLGLDPDKVYYLLRDPAELEKAAPTFNNIPVLDRHIPVTVDDPQKDRVVGSTGTDAAFNSPYLTNSLVIWDAVAIVGVTTREQCELSSAYRYDAEMTPGTYEGVHYDGIMRNIRGNHVALVDVGRAGPDVVVGDSKLLEIPQMSGKKLSATAIAVRGALFALLKPKIAQDAQIKDLTAIVGSVKAATFAKDKQSIIDAVAKKFKIAADADLADLAQLMDAFSGDDVAADDTDELPVSMDASASDQLLALLKGAGLSPELMEQATALCGQMAPAAAADEFPPAKEDPAKKPPEASTGVQKPAMDKAIAEAEQRTVKRMNDMHQALRDVEPIVGAIVAMDCAESVYKLALDQVGVVTKDVHPSAYRSMVELYKKGASTASPVSRIAQDKANAKSFNERFPNAVKSKGGV